MNQVDKLYSRTGGTLKKRVSECRVTGAQGYDCRKLMLMALFDSTPRAFQLLEGFSPLVSFRGKGRQTGCNLSKVAPSTQGERGRVELVFRHQKCSGMFLHVRVLFAF